MLDFSLENLEFSFLVAQEFQSNEIWLELPDACDLREQRGVESFTYTKLADCYRIAQKFYLKLVKSNEFKVEQPILLKEHFEGTSYFDIAATVKDENYLDDLISSANKTLHEFHSNNNGIVFELSVKEFGFGNSPENLGIFPYVFSRRILVTEKTNLAIELNFYLQRTGQRIGRFLEFRETLQSEPACYSEKYRVLLGTDFSEKFVNFLALSTN